MCLSAAECLDRLLEDGDEYFFLPRRLPGEVSMPAAAEATLRRVVIANERRMLRCLLLLLGVVVIVMLMLGWTILIYELILEHFVCVCCS